MLTCDSKCPFIANIVKLIPNKDCSRFGCLTRIICGCVKSGDKVRVLGENYIPDDEEDSTTQVVTSVEISQARYHVPLNRGYPGNIVILRGLDTTVIKSATLVSEFIDEECFVFKSLHYQNTAVIKIATEPLNPAELPKMLDGLRKINKSFPLAITKVEESGEHTIFGTGELYLDCLLRDLREMYADIEIKVADPVVAFCETVVDMSSLKCFAKTPNFLNHLTMICEPLDKGLAEDIETSQVSLDKSKKQVGDFFQTHYGWDMLSARRVWAFGPNRTGPNLLQDDTLPTEVDQSLLIYVKESVIQGFQWGTKEGPLCEEPIRNIKFKILDAQLSTESLYRNGGQIIPTARKCCYSAFFACILKADGTFLFC
jgi:U5 small nuclear ribonucleoprotein component